VFRRQPRRRNGAGGAGAAIGGIALIFLALAALGSLALFYFSVVPKPKLDPVSLCPVDGPHGITVVLVTHEPDIAQYARRMVAMKDGRMILDQPVRKRRNASVELAATPLEEVLQ